MTMLSKKASLQLAHLGICDTDEKVAEFLRIVEEDRLEHGSKCDGCPWKNNSEVCRVQCGED